MLDIINLWCKFQFIIFMYSLPACLFPQLLYNSLTAFWEYSSLKIDQKLFRIIAVDERKVRIKSDESSLI